MTKFTMIGVACLAAALATASPALARDGHGGGHGGGFHRGGGHVSGFRGGGFGVVPGIAAGVIAGAALGSYNSYGPGPGYYDNSYAYDGNPIYDEGYAARNGFVCQPGTWFRGEDGRPHLCQ